MHAHLLLINIPWTCMVYSPKQSTVPQHSPCSLALATCHSPADQGVQPVPFITSFSLESTKNILTLLAGHWAGIGQFSSADLKYWEKLKIWARGRQEDFEFDFFGVLFQTIPISISEKQCQAHQVLTGSLVSWTFGGELFLIQCCVTNSPSIISHMELSSVRDTSLLIWQRCHKPYAHANHIFLLCRHFAESTQASPAKPRN